jgi:hypothetical protein
VIVAVIVLALALAIALAVIGGLVRSHQGEREQWAQERRALTDRVIARHIGEVLALDRNAQRPTIDDRGEPVLIEGLS